MCSHVCHTRLQKTVKFCSPNWHDVRKDTQHYFGISFLQGGVLWDKTPCSMRDAYRRFRRNDFLHHQIHLPWRNRKKFPLQRRYISITLYGVTVHNTVTFYTTANSKRNMLLWHYFVWSLRHVKWHTTLPLVQTSTQKWHTT